MSERLGEYRRLLAAAILRSHDAPLISDDYLEEAVQGKHVDAPEF